MAPPLILRVIGDATSWFRTADETVSSQTKIEKGALAMGDAFSLSARKQVEAGTLAIKSQREQLAQLKALQAATVEGTDARIAADVAVAKSQERLNRAMGLTAVASGTLSTAEQKGERDVGKLTRGLLAGSGAASSLGRSLAFASTGFIAIAGGATLISSSIKAALDLAATQRQVDQQLQTSGKSWDQYGGMVDKVLSKESHLSGFTRQDLLQSFGYLVRVGGNVRESLKLDAVAADVARGRHIALSSASIALAKALGGSNTALRRLGIIIPDGLGKMKALEYVQQKFAGQAEAGATAADHFHASLVNAEETIGTALLPTFDRLSTDIGDWIDKMERSGRLQKDMNELVTLSGHLFHTLGDAIGYVDDVTGSLGNSTKLLVEIYAGFKIVQFVGWVNQLAIKWGLVEAAATKAAEAEGAAAVAGGAGGARGGGGGGGLLTGLLGGSLLGRVLGRGGTSGVVARVGMYTGGEEAAAVGASATGIGALAVASIVAAGALDDFAKTINTKAGGGSTGNKIADAITGFFTGGLAGNSAFSPWHGLFGAIIHGHAPFASAFQNTFGSGPAAPPPSWLMKSPYLPPWLQLPGMLGQAVSGTQGPFGNAQPMTQFTTAFITPYKIQLAQAEAGVTKSMTDDVAAAKKLILYIKTLMDEGRLHGAALLQALQAEAGALATVQAAADARKQAAAAKAAAAKALASTYTIPGNLQLAEAEAQAYGQDQTAILKKIIAAAKAAIASGKKNWQGMVAAYQVIAQAQAQLNAQAQQALIPLKLQLDLAKAQALGTDQTAILLKMKAALMKALKKAKGNIEQQITIWNQIASINQQLGQGTNNAYGDYKKASVKALTAGLGLTAAQRRAEEARLARLGPGGTTPSSGTGAAGYIIDPNTGRPVHRRHRRRGSDYTAGGGGGGDRTLQATIDLNVYIDGKQVEATVTKHQQRRRRHNPTSRRGPNAATATA